MAHFLIFLFHDGIAIDMGTVHDAGDKGSFFGRIGETNVKTRIGNPGSQERNSSELSVFWSIFQ